MRALLPTKLLNLNMITKVFVGGFVNVKLLYNF